MKILRHSLLTLIASTFIEVHAGVPVKPIEPVMETIPAGRYTMGSEKRRGDEKPHTVSIAAFSMGKYEVTVREFRQFIEATGYQAPTECRHELDGWFKLASKGNWEVNQLTTSEFQPVVCINWRAADAYVKWLAQETGKPYRLPSEAEWEYAARAGTDTDYYFGDDPDRTAVCEYANTADIYGENILQRDAKTSYYNWSTGMANCVDHAAYASIVGMYKPNQFGLHDMVSNVQEMLADCFVSGYEGAPTDGSARIEQECDTHSVRSGSWHWNNWPVTNRGRIGKDFAGGVDGFRIAMDGKATMAKSTKRFYRALKQAQQIESKRRQLIPEIPQPVTNLTLQQSNNGVTLTWDNQADTVDGYRVYRNNLAGNTFTLLAANLTDNHFTDSHQDTHKYDYTVVAVSNHLQSVYADPVSTEAGWLNIADRVEAEWASELSGAVVSYSSDKNERRGNVLTGRDGIAENGVMVYQLDVPQTGDYLLSYRVASPRDTKGFEVFNDEVSMGVFNVSETGGYHEWQTQVGSLTNLKKGKVRLVIKSRDNNWKLNWLSLKPQPSGV